MSDSSSPTDGIDSARGPVNALIRFCLKNRLVVALFALFLVGWGVYVAPFDWKIGGIERSPVPVDAIPDVGENQQIVFTQWMGRSPQDVEDQITYPMTVSLLGIPGVKTVRSYSFFGFSSIYIIFEEDIDFYWSRSRVLEKLSSLPPGTLPENVRPTLGPDATALGQVFWYTLEGRDPEGNPAGGWDLDELRSVQDWNVRYALLAANGISEVASVGGFVREYQIDVDPDAMKAHGVTLGDVFASVKMSNLDVGARTIEVNSVEYVIRGLGFIEDLSDIEQAVVKTTDNVPVRVRDVAVVTRGPAMRRGALDKEGAEAVGGVVVVRYGFNPLAAIGNVKAKLEEIAPGLPAKAVVDHDLASRAEVNAFASERGFEAYDGATLNHEEWLSWLRSTPRDKWPAWVTTSQVTVVPFYDRTGLIYETLGTLEEALTLEILITVIVVIVMVLHLRSSLIISAVLPLAVLICFVAMKTFGVDANIVALSGIAIAIGTMVDMGIIVCENILRHLESATEEQNRLDVVFSATSEVGSAVLTAVATTVISFLPVFTMTGAEGKLFKPLAFTKTFALVASVVVALTIIPVASYVFFRRKGEKQGRALVLPVVTLLAGALAWWKLAWWAGLILVLIGAWRLLSPHLPKAVGRFGPWAASAAAVVVVAVLLADRWLPLGPETGFILNFIFVAVLVGGLLLFFHVFMRLYGRILRFFLDHKVVFLSIPAVLVILGALAWLGPGALFGPLEAVPQDVFSSEDDIDTLVERGWLERRPGELLWTAEALGESPQGVEDALDAMGVTDTEPVIAAWRKARYFTSVKREPWGLPEEEEAGRGVRAGSLKKKTQWTLARSWDGLGKEFMPPLDEGSFLLMPTTMPHASIGEALDVLQKQDMALAAIPEIESVVGKIGRAETPLDPAPISMVETVINYLPEYRSDSAGHRMLFAYDAGSGEFVRDKDGELIPDKRGRPYRQWRDEIRTPDDIWDEITKAAAIPGSTAAPRLQPIAARMVMLQSGMRAPMGVKVKGPDLETIEKAGLEIERLLKNVPSVEPTAVIADRIVGKPYIEIDIDREAIARYGLSIHAVQEVIEVAIGGRNITTTVEGRERYGVRVRYMRELRDRIDSLGRVLVAGKGGVEVPLSQMASIRYVRGPMAIKSEDTRLVGYVLFDRKPGYAEVDVVEDAEAYLRSRIDSGEFMVPAGVSYTFAGNYENQLRAQQTLSLVLPAALFTIFMILYFQFRSISTTGLVFSGIVVAWAGGFLLVWLYGQPWFMDFSVFGTGMRDLFGVHTVNLSVAIWVGFLALFGIASDNGVVIATYLDQSFAARDIASVEDVRAATVAGAVRRIRPCLMTSATTILALLPVLTSTGRGSDVMVPMAIPSFGGMLVVLVSVFVVPVLYCLVAELRLKASPASHPVV